MNDPFIIGGVTLTSRLFIGTGKYGADSLSLQWPKPAARKSSPWPCAVWTNRAKTRLPARASWGISPPTCAFCPTPRAREPQRKPCVWPGWPRAAGCGDWIKIEVISDTRHLLPDGYETAKATEILAKDGFTVLPYINPDLYVARACANAGAAAVMPLGAPIGTNRGLRTKEMVGILIEEIDLPIVVDAGIGRPSQACEAMEMGAAACLVNTAIASSSDPVSMARAFGAAVRAGRDAWLAGPGAVKAQGQGAEASSPLTGFLR